MHRRTVMTALILAAPFIFWACTITPEATADQVGKMLVAADFKFKTANTLQQMKRMQALPQRRFIRHQAGDDVSYLYADVAGCKCVWRGDKLAYRRYKELARERKVEYKNTRVKLHIIYLTQSRKARKGNNLKYKIILAP